MPGSKSRRRLWFGITLLLVAAVIGAWVWFREPRYQGRNVTQWLDRATKTPGMVTTTMVANATYVVTPTTPTVVGTVSSSRTVISNPPSVIVSTGRTLGAVSPRTQTVPSSTVSNINLAPQWDAARERDRQAVLQGQTVFITTPTPILGPLTQSKKWSTEFDQAILAMRPRATKALIKHLLPPEKTAVYKINKILGRFKFITWRLDPPIDRRVVASRAIILANEDSDATLRLLLPMIAKDKATYGGGTSSILNKLFPNNLERSLLKNFSASDPWIRAGAAKAAGWYWMNSMTHATIPGLIELLEDKNADVRTEAARALGKIAGNPEACLDPLRKALRDKKPTVRAASAYALGEFKKEARPAIADLELATRDKVNEVSYNAKVALEKIGPAP